MPGPSPKARSAFTLLEVLAVVLLTTIVIGAVLNHYVNLNRASERATRQTQEVRRSAALLDRVARDLESAILVTKPDEVDPLFHPWRFVAYSDHVREGADHLLFVSRGRRPREGSHESDLEVVSYALEPSQEGAGFSLMRWTSPRLEDALETEIPNDESDGALLLADGIGEFGVTFVDPLGERLDFWDSSTLEQSSTLPLAAEIHVAFLDPWAEPDPDVAALDRPLYRRTIVFPVRELDLVELLDPLSLVSGGPGNPEEQAEMAEGDNSMATAQCLQSPCGNMTACQAINCAAEIGQHGDSVDRALEQTMQTNMPFCQWVVGFSSLRHLVDNPACLP